MLHALLPLALAVAWPAAAEVRITQGPQSATIEINGEPFTTLHFGKQAGKPFLHPLRTASGKIITRGYPVDPQPGEDAGLPYQVGVWVGQQSVNGVDYWEVDPNARPASKVGSVVLKNVTGIEQAVDRGSISFVSGWVDPDGAAVLTENRTMAFAAGAEDSRIIDIDVRIEPLQRISIADRTGGILGLRLGAAFAEINGGRPRIFSGDAGSDGVTGKRSPWLDYMTIMKGERIGVLIMDHPRNYNFPTRWKVRTYASIFATPFGELDYYNEAPLKGPPPKTARHAGVTLDKGEQMRLRYRIVIHSSIYDIDQAWRDFCDMRWEQR
jgi:hypothetical protein